MKIRTTVALLLITVCTVPAFAQNRFMDQAKEAADRRSEHKAIREAENPEAVAKPAKPATTAEATAPAPAEPAAAPAPEPAAPAPAAPAPAKPAQ